MNPRLAPVLSDRDLPVAELCSARLDGELYPLGDGWCPVDEPDTAYTRAQAAALLVPRRAIAERLTAAWIFGAAPEPRQQHFCVAVSARVHMSHSPRVHLREVLIPADDVLRVGALRVTCPQRTLSDLARDPGIPDREVIPVLAALLACTHCDASRVSATLPHGGRVRTMAQARLQAATAAGARAQPSLTR